jgi:hypothetical protein
MLRLVATQMKHLELIALKLSQQGFSWGYASHTDRTGRKWFVIDASCGDGKRYITRSDEMLSAFLELERQLLPRTGRCVRASSVNQK